MTRQMKIIGAIVLLFIIYMTFFDQNNWLLQRERMQNLEKTKENIEYLKSESEKMDKELNGLVNKQDVIEKTAREKYFHKKDSEDVYIVIDTTKKD